MLNIRDAQVDLFRREARERFVARLIPLLRESCGPSIQALGDEELRGRIQFALARANQHGATWESSAYAYVALSVLLGPRFDTHPQVRELLADTSLIPNERIKRLPQLLPPDVWRSAGQEPCGSWDDSPSAPEQGGN